MNRILHSLLMHERISTRRRFVRKFPLPLRGKGEINFVGADCIRPPAPSPQSSPVEGEEVRTESVVDKTTLFFLIVSIPLWLASFAHGQTKEKVRVALGSISVNTSVIPVGHQYGLYAKYGVDLEPIYMGGGMNSLAAVTSNSVQFLSAGSTATISARLGGMDITMLSVQSSKLEYSIFAAPEIKTPQDLKGKIVTGTRPGASADSALRLILRKWGLEPGKDVIFISVGESQQGRMNALQRGSVAATALTPPFSGIARQLGFRELIDMRKSDIEYAGSSIAGMVGYIKSHPQLVENFLKGYIESLHFFRSQKEKTVAGIMKFMKLNDRSKAEEGYEYYLDLMPVMPYASVAGVKAVLQFLAAGQPKAATANPEEFFDHSILKKIEDSGFAKPFAIRR